MIKVIKEIEYLRNRLTQDETSAPFLLRHDSFTIPTTMFHYMDVTTLNISLPPTLYRYGLCLIAPSPTSLKVQIAPSPEYNELRCTIDGNIVFKNGTHPAFLSNIPDNPKLWDRIYEAFDEHIRPVLITVLEQKLQNKKAIQRKKQEQQQKKEQQLLAGWGVAKSISLQEARELVLEHQKEIEHAWEPEETKGELNEKHDEEGTLPSELDKKECTLYLSRHHVHVLLEQLEGAQVQSNPDDIMDIQNRLNTVLGAIENEGEQDW